MKIKLRRGNSGAWTSANPVLALGEVGLEMDTHRFKVGDGTSTWNSLAYWVTGGGGGDVGPQGPAGPAGPEGPAGPAGQLDVRVQADPPADPDVGTIWVQP